MEQGTVRSATSTTAVATAAHPTGADPGDDQGALRVVPWVDPLVDSRGVDPRSSYVERFWLGVLGPSATLLIRHLADRFDTQPDGFELDRALTARALGLSPRSGRNAPFSRALQRCARFGMVRFVELHTVAARRRLGPVPQRLLVRLPAELQAIHGAIVPGLDTKSGAGERAGGTGG